MATFYKYAERTAESQVNWAEIGKDMTDMLRQEVAVREEKKAAIDEATRRYAEELSNAPQGEHEPGSTEALRFADQATKYMLQQEKLLKSGLLDPRDYMIARQNLTDGTRQAFGAMKEFQAKYAELMERAKTDKSSLLEIENLEEIQGYGNFRQSGFFIDSPTGRVNVGLKEEQDIDGQKVMGLKKGSTRGMQYIQGGIYGRIDKFKPREALVGIADTLGTEIQASIDPATMSKLGSITSVEDLRLRNDIVPATKEVLFEFYSSMKSSVNSAMANPLQKASLLRDTLGYTTTTDPEAAAKDPNLILKVTDPDTGRAEYKFNDTQNAAAEKWMTGQLLGMITRKETIDQGGQVSRQRADSTGEDAEQKARADAKNIAENLVFALTGDENKSNSGTKFISGLTGIDFNKTKNGFSIEDENGNLQEFKFRADGKTLADPTSFVKSFVGPLARVYDINQDVLIREFQNFLPKGATLNETTEATGFQTQASDQAPLDELNTIVSESVQNPNLTKYIDTSKDKGVLASQFNKYISPKLSEVEFGTDLMGNNIYVNVKGVKSKSYEVGDKTKNRNALKQMQDFIINTYAKGGTAEEKEMAAEAVLSGLPKTSRNTGGVGSKY
jgi:hypothetical protein